MVENALEPLAKSVLIPLELIAASATDVAVHKKMFGSRKATLIVSNEEMNEIMKIDKCLEESGLSINNEKIKQKIKKEDFLGALGASLLGNLLTGKQVTRAGDGTIRASQDF